MDPPTYEEESHLPGEDMFPYSSSPPRWKENDRGSPSLVPPNLQAATGRPMKYGDEDEHGAGAAWGAEMQMSGNTHTLRWMNIGTEELMWSQESSSLETCAGRRRKPSG